ncbi:interleukin-31 receptor subunit alpha isoform X2 [Aquarana catesbeiana]|uniref:interleukin-31 receptor subunit alpha isoform X2 n=1 Tax=Aquarana catesbeiana TaxID=8400 RepID=UPI003CCA5EB1
MFGTSWILVMAVKLLLADDDLLREAQIFPHVEYVQLGTSATFFCKVNSSIYTSAHLSWTLNPNITAGVQDGCLSESVRFITIQNISAVSVEIICKIPASDSYKDLPLDKIFIKTGNPPETPHNISCIYFHIRNLTCTWITGKKTRLPTIFTLSRITSLGKSVLCRTKKNFCTSFYLGDGEHLDGEYEVQVEAENNLGKAASPVIQVNTYILAPSHSVELWRVITNLNNARLVHLLWKEKSIVKQSGITQGFVVQWHPENSIFARQNKTTRQNEMVLDLPNKAYMISVIYYNSAGSSPSATLRIPASEEKTQSLIHNAQVFIKNNTVAMIWNVTDMRIKTYMVEWGMDSILNPCSNISFQQVENSLEWTGDKGIFEPYTRYRISVYPILEEKVEAPYISYFYVKEAAPLHGPNTTVVNLRETEATIKWDPIRQDDANGFITSFSVVYNSLNGHESVATVSSDVYEYTLQSLKPKTLYTAYVVASTQAGNTSGHRVHFTTLQYKSEDFGHVIGTIGVLVVLVVVFGIAYTRKKEMIKHLFWPDVPDPAHSSITEWSSDLVKAALLVNPEESDGVFHKGELQVLHTVYINEKAFLKDEEGRKRLSADTVRSTDSRTSQEDSSPVHYAITEFRHELLESMPLLQSTSCSMTSSCSSLVSSLGDMHSEIQETPHVLELEQLSGDILAEVNPYLKNSVNTRETIHFVNS